jgi:1,4-alpha-glucan branching enzyme
MAPGKDLPILAQNDPWLTPYAGVILKRKRNAEKKEKELLGGNESLGAFANGHLFFGLHRINSSWVIREWAPNATGIFLIGDFCGWKPDHHFAFQKKENGVWEITLSPEALKHGDLYRLNIHWNGGQGDRIPAWATRVVQDPVTLIFNAQVWDPPKHYQWKKPDFKNKNGFPLIYETHIGMATQEEKVGTYNEFRELVLPRIHKAGYNTIQLMAIQEHPYYGSFGYHVSSFFAPSSRFGTPEELKALVDEAHRLGISVIMDLVHSHAVKNETEGLGKFDGTPYQYFHDGPRREHVAWDSLCFNYGKNEVLHFLLSNCKYWLEEFHFDGFRFDGITSMLYLNHGLGTDFTEYGMYFNGNQDEDAISYCIMANKLIHQVKPVAITIAEEMSGMPGTASPIDWGGLGFDYRLSMGTPDYWIKIIKEVADEKWNVGEIYHELTNRRRDEKTIGYAESHDQALVGDKTIIFRLIDKEMYFSMDKNIQNISVDRGIALHKMIRLITLTTAGNGYLNFMGNEFGHPEWIDFPREGNHWSYSHARRQWWLLDNPDLKYHYLADFDKDMLEMAKSAKLLNDGDIRFITSNMPDQILAYQRAGLIFIFNFNPFRSFTDYGIRAEPGKYKIILSTDSKKFGGLELTDESMSHYTVSLGKPGFIESHMLKLYLPARTAFVLKSQPVKNVYDLIK